MKNISPKEAIEVLKDMKIETPLPKAAVTQRKRNAAIEMAIDVLKYSELPNSSDLISRAEAIKTAHFPVIDDASYEVVRVDDILVLPPARPERKKGEWIYGEHDIAMCDGYWCDQCGFFVPWDYKHKFIDFIKDYHWCPSCGADMRGEEDG